MEDRKAIYDSFEEKLRAELIKLCTQFEKLNGKLLSSPDIDEKWDEYARECVSDAVVNFNGYPVVALAWAAYLGAGVASRWDCGWESHKSDKYQDYYGAQGYDDMDEHITRDIIGKALDSMEAKEMAALFSTLAEKTLGLIRHEGFESQSVEAYYILIRCVKVMYQIGASVELKRLGYNCVPVNVK